jgi:hypothetical protein
MCPACIESTVVMVAGVTSTGGALALCIGKFRKFFHFRGLFQKKKGEMTWQETYKETT